MLLRMARIEELPSNENETSIVTASSRQRIFYSQLRIDRSGSVIQDMLMAHAFAFASDMSYGGACERQQGKAKALDIQRLIRGLGLQDELLIACPSNEKDAKIPIVERDVYALQGTAVFTDRWLDYIYSKIHYPLDVEDKKDESLALRTKQTSKPTRQRRAVLHIRRGDVQPCNDPEDRYLPNAYYQQTLLEHVPSDYQITIHSESQSLEGWDDLKKTLTNKWNTIDWKFDSPILTAWKDMMTADIFVMSKSSFSIIPAILNRQGIIIYTPFWYEPLPHWQQSKVNYRQDLYRLKQQCYNQSAFRPVD
jgi:hypothetical protein